MLSRKGSEYVNEDLNIKDKPEKLEETLSKKEVENEEYYSLSPVKEKPKKEIVVNKNKENNDGI